MPTCVYCYAETQLYINGVPVCKACSEDLEAGHNPPHERPLKSDDKGKAS